MSSESALRRYLQTVQTQWRQIGDVIEDVQRPSDEDRGIQPPERNSEALRSFFKEAAAEVSEAHLFDEVNPWLEELQYRHEGLVEEAWECRKRRAWSRLDWDEAEAAWKELDKLAVFVEARLKAGRASEAQQEQSGKRPTKGVIFDDEKRVVTINGFAYPVIDDDRAFRLFKLVAEARGEIVSRKTILRSIKGLDGKNTLLNTKKKLPKQLQYCLESIQGREGGYRYRPPKNK